MLLSQIAWWVYIFCMYFYMKFFNMKHYICPSSVGRWFFLLGFHHQFECLYQCLHVIYMGGKWREANNLTFFSEGGPTQPKGQGSLFTVHGRHLGGAQTFFLLNWTEATCKWLLWLGNTGNPLIMKVVGGFSPTYFGPWVPAPPHSKC